MDAQQIEESERKSWRYSLIVSLIVALFITVGTKNGPIGIAAFIFSWFLLDLLHGIYNRLKDLVLISKQ